MKHEKNSKITNKRRPYKVCINLMQHFNMQTKAQETINDTKERTRLIPCFHYNENCFSEFYIRYVFSPIPQILEKTLDITTLLCHSTFMTLLVSLLRIACDLSSHRNHLSREDKQITQVVKVFTPFRNAVLNFLNATPTPPT